MCRPRACREFEDGSLKRLQPPAAGADACAVMWWAVVPLLPETRRFVAAFIHSRTGLLGCLRPRAAKRASYLLVRLQPVQSIFRSCDRACLMGGFWMTFGERRVELGRSQCHRVRHSLLLSGSRGWMPAWKNTARPVPGWKRFREAGGQT